MMSGTGSPIDIPLLALSDSNQTVLVSCHRALQAYIPGGRL